jgi:hypothetical protein
VGEFDTVGISDAAVAGSSLQCEPVDDEFLLCFGQEAGRFWTIREIEPHDRGESDRRETLKDENPFPAEEIVSILLNRKPEITLPCQT